MIREEKTESKLTFVFDVQNQQQQKREEFEKKKIGNNNVNNP